MKTRKMIIKGNQANNLIISSPLWGMKNLTYADIKQHLKEGKDPKELNRISYTLHNVARDPFCEKIDLQLLLISLWLEMQDRSQLTIKDAIYLWQPAIKFGYILSFSNPLEQCHPLKLWDIFEKKLFFLYQNSEDKNIISLILNTNTEMLRTILDESIQQSILDQDLIRACSNEKPNFEEIKNLVEKGANTRSKDWGHRTCLHRLCELEFFYPQIIKYLIDNNGDLNQNNLWKQTCLHVFLREKKRSVSELMFLVDNGAKLDILDFNHLNLLQVLCISNNATVEIIEFLIEKGFDVNASHVRGKPLALSCGNLNPSPEVMKCLIKHGADVKSDQRDHSPLNVLFSYVWIDRFPDPNAVKVLMDYGAQLSELNEGKCKRIFATEHVKYSLLLMLQGTFPEKPYNKNTLLYRFSDYLKNNGDEKELWHIFKNELYDLCTDRNMMKENFHIFDQEYKKQVMTMLLVAKDKNTFFSKLPRPLREITAFISLPNDLVSLILILPDHVINKALGNVLDQLECNNRLKLNK